MKALPINIYKNPMYKGCSNGGISEKYDSLLLIHPEGFIDIDEDDLPENLVKVVERRLFGKIYKHIEPVARPEGVGWMSGGAFAASSDSRFHDISDYPLSIHDRQESAELNERMSR